MPSPEEWGRLFEAARASEPIVVNAHTYRKSWASFSRPVLLACDDQREYVVKGSQVGRAVFNDQAIGRLGKALGVPVGDVTLVNVPAELLALNRPAMDHLPAGIAHGCRFVPQCSERMGIGHVSEDSNRDRYARLAIFYGWISASDHQFFYNDTAPHLVHSFDHGHFFPGGPNWTEASLAGAPPPSPDHLIVTPCGLNAEEIGLACSLLHAVTPEVVADAVVVPPASWGGVTDQERLALANYLLTRCEAFRP